jgi:CelD/BcsL family acetyltransferase involved in cellulose biosynthesis
MSAVSTACAIAPAAAMEGATRGAAPVVRERIVDAVPPELAAEWQALAGRASEPNAFAEPWFVAPSLKHLRDEAVRLVEVRASTRLTGLIMLGVERQYGRVPMPHVQNWRHHHLFLGTPLIAAGEEEAFWAGLLDHLDGSRWAPNFLHVHGLGEDGPVLRGLQASARVLGRETAIVHREVRAFLQSELPPQAYYETTVRKKKRKELARLRNRLAELGTLVTRRLRPEEPLAPWCDAFLRLESNGWKGREGSALACNPATEAFFRDALAAARDAGRLELLSLELDGRPLAMLVNFLAPPGSFSFKTAFDEEYARFSPGVLLQLENLAILERPDVGWMDSCAAEAHPMIDSLWGERRAIVRVTVPLRGLRRRIAFGTARTLEKVSAALRRPRHPNQEGEEA